MAFSNYFVIIIIFGFCAAQNKIIDSQVEVLRNYEEATKDLLKSNGEFVKSVIDQQVVAFRESGLFSREFSFGSFKEYSGGVYLSIKTYLTGISKIYASVSDLQCRQIELIENTITYTTNSIYILTKQATKTMQTRMGLVQDWLTKYVGVLNDESKDTVQKIFATNMDIGSAIKNFAEKLEKAGSIRTIDIQISVKSIFKDTFGKILASNKDSLNVLKQEIAILQTTFSKVLGSSQEAVGDLINDAKTAIDNIAKIPQSGISSLVEDVSAASTHIGEVIGSGVKDPIATLQKESENAINGLKDTADNGIKNLQLTSNMSIQAISTVPGKLGKTLGEIVNNLKDGLNGAKKVAENQTSITAENVEIQLGSAINLVKAMGVSIQTVLQTSVKDYIKTVKEQAKILETTLGFHFKTLKNLSSEFGQKAFIATQMPFNLTINSVELVNAKAADTIRHTIANLIFTSNTAIDELSSGLKEAAKTSAKTIKEVSSGLGKSADETIKAVQEAAKNTVNISAEAIKSAPDVIKEESGHSQRIASEIVTQIQQDAGTAKDKLVDAAKIYLNSPLDTLQNLPVNQLNLVSSAVDEAKTQIEKSNSNLGTMLADNIKHISEHYDDTSNKIVKELGKVLAKLDGAMNDTRVVIIQGVGDQTNINKNSVEYYVKVLKHLGSLSKDDFHTGVKEILESLRETSFPKIQLPNFKPDVTPESVCGIGKKSKPTMSKKKLTLPTQKVIN